MNRLLAWDPTSTARFDPQPDDLDLVRPLPVVYPGGYQPPPKWGDSDCDNDGDSSSAEATKDEDGEDAAENVEVEKFDSVANAGEELVDVVMSENATVGVGAADKTDGEKVGGESNEENDKEEDNAGRNVARKVVGESVDKVVTRVTLEAEDVNAIFELVGIGVSVAGKAVSEKAASENEDDEWGDSEGDDEGGSGSAGAAKV